MKKGVIPVLTPPAGASPAVNTAAAWTLAANSNQGWAIKQIIFGYGANPTTGSLTIVWGANTQTYPITNGGPGPLIFDPPRVFPINTAIVLTLAAGGSGISGTISDVGAWLTMEGVGA